MPHLSGPAAPVAACGLIAEPLMQSLVANMQILVDLLHSMVGCAIFGA
jgi:hypothetical protein